MPGDDLVDHVELPQVWERERQRHTEHALDWRDEVLEEIAACEFLPLADNEEGKAGEGKEGDGKEGKEGKDGKDGKDAAKPAAKAGASTSSSSGGARTKAPPDWAKRFSDKPRCRTKRRRPRTVPSTASSPS